RIRETGPEIGARTWVERSPLNATVPVVMTEGKNVEESERSILNRSRWPESTTTWSGLALAAAEGGASERSAARPQAAASRAVAGGSGPWWRDSALAGLGRRQATGGRGKAMPVRRTPGARSAWLWVRPKVK